MTEAAEVLTPSPVASSQSGELALGRTSERTLLPLVRRLYAIKHRCGRERGYLNVRFGFESARDRRFNRILGIFENVTAGLVSGFSLESRTKTCSSELFEVVDQ
jgi:hypothetical protein